MARTRKSMLDEILSDPIVRELMAADGVTATDIRRLYRLLDDDGENLPAHVHAERITDSHAPA